MFRFFWSGVGNDVADICACCQVCQKVVQQTTHRVRLVPLTVMVEPFKRIAMDMVRSLLEIEQGHQYIFTIYDCGACFLNAFPM